ncbi:enoyl-CoA hydratase-related protein [Caballeronia sp. dw_19]|uniref:enoyl-CoA hydratase-related protein n=1 Tax=Caballeronia sp. dw_19 TaxID=2719791 RepID=UPI001BD34401|nr:enoyl-CoA hydratase-related protein [Caballeronia sp. dw_19]
MAIKAAHSPDVRDESAHATYRLADGIAWIALNRPDRLNAMTPEMDAALRVFVQTADADPDCLVICITGEGKGFCSGADLGTSPVANGAIPYASEPKTLNEFRFGYLSVSRKPIVAAINGAAIGVGLVLAAFCDVRIAAANAKLGFTYSRVGLVAEYGIAWWLPRMIGAGASRDLLLSGRVVDASEALRLGLVDQLADEASFDTHVAGYLRLLVERCAPQSMATIKAQLSAASDETLLGAIASSDRALQGARTGADFAEGRAAFTEKRLPRFARLTGQTGDPS